MTPLFQRAGELALVAAGVLLALAADAAWDRRQDRAEEARYVANLLEEARSALDEIERDQNLRLTFVAIADSLEAQFTRRSAPDSVVARWIAYPARQVTPGFFPPSAVLNDLLSSGKLDLIESVRLRLALMEYSQEVPRLQTTEEWGRTFVEDHYVPFVVDHISTAGDPTPGSVNALLASQTFQNLLSILQMRMDYTVSQGGRSVEMALTELLAVLTEETPAS